MHVYATFSSCILGHFCCFHLVLASLNVAAVTLLMQISLADPTLNSFGYILSSGMAESYDDTI